MEFRDINHKIVAIYKVVFFIFGTIGNVLFIHMIIRKKQLQSRTSILQCFQCFFHLFCQLGTVSTGVFEERNTLNRGDCYDIIAFYVFFQAAQGLIMVIIVADIFVLVRFPIFYLNISTTVYVIFTSFPVLAFSISTTYLGYLSQDEGRIPSCSPPFVFQPKAGVSYKYLFISFSIVVMVFFIIIIRLFHKKHNQNHNQHSLKTIRRLKVSVVIYIVTWLFSQVFGLAILKMNAYSSWRGIIASHNNLFLCLSYSNTFYVTMWRCKEYRDHFHSLWWPNRTSRSEAIAVFRSSQSLPRRQSSNVILNRS
ncbi:hypothetical protein CAEBREN_17450 [Caenorhabditis brenneri]|uniref:G-protein coupled receptors family 1 profile domain-containing protein n=1 Tax=Caenorhabditis brenneri TaxID=135651 RepID=G0MS39_CAEBE|nr:hypothetical protein CAEBREN_17450 [Caenorhabditis brenneri]